MHEICIPILTILSQNHIIFTKIPGIWIKYQSEKTILHKKEKGFSHGCLPPFPLFLRTVHGLSVLYGGWGCVNEESIIWNITNTPKINLCIHMRAWEHSKHKWHAKIYIGWAIARCKAQIWGTWLLLCLYSYIQGLDPHEGTRGRRAKSMSIVMKGPSRWSS